MPSPSGQRVDYDCIAHLYDEPLREFLDYASQRHRTSQLLVISDPSYEEGLDALREDIQRYGESWQLESKICLVTITGDKR